MEILGLIILLPIIAFLLLGVWGIGERIGKTITGQTSRENAERIIEAIRESEELREHYNDLREGEKERLREITEQERWEKKRQKMLEEAETQRRKMEDYQREVAFREQEKEYARLRKIRQKEKNELNRENLKRLERLEAEFAVGKALIHDVLYSPDEPSIRQVAERILGKSYSNIYAALLDVMHHVWEKHCKVFSYESVKAFHAPNASVETVRWEEFLWIMDSKLVGDLGQFVSFARHIEELGDEDWTKASPTSVEQFKRYKKVFKPAAFEFHIANRKAVMDAGLCARQPKWLAERKP